MRRSVCVGILYGLLVGALPAAASPFQVLGAGSRASAMLVGTGLARGPEAVFYNPAGLIGETNTRVDLGFQIADLGLEINRQDMDEEGIRETHLGVVHPTEFLGRELGIGVLLSIPFSRAYRFLTLPLDQPQYLYYGARNQRLVMMAAGGVKITDWCSIGAGVQIQVDSFSEPVFSVIQDPDSTNDTEDPAADALEPRSFGSASSVQDPVLSPILGVRFKLQERFRLGVTYRGESVGSISAPLKVYIEEVNLFGATLAESLFDLPNIAKVFFNPQEVSIGLAYETQDGKWTAGLDVTWSDWSAFPPTFGEGLPNFTGGLAQVVLPVTSFLPIAPPTRDTITPAVGLEWHAWSTDRTDLWLRGGYSYRPAMVREDRGLTNFLDTGAHIFGAGFGWEVRKWSRILPKPLTVEAHVQMHVLEERKILKDDPASSPFGDMLLTGMILGGGLQATVRF